jgi:hypothetical protein
LVAEDTLLLAENDPENIFDTPKFKLFATRFPDALIL